MDLRKFYSKWREEEAAIGEEFPVVVSLETSDGGRAGSPSEVNRALAAKLIVEGKARLSTPEEATQFRERVAEAKRAIDQASAASKLQVTIVSEAELRNLRARQGKG